MANLEMKRHSYSHVLAQAVRNIYGNGVKLAIGPSIDTGFYYDFDFGEVTPPTEEELKALEKEMKHLLRQNQSFAHSTMKIDEAIAWFEKMGEPYKKQLAEELKVAGETEASFYTNVNVKGEETFQDMCI